MLIIHLAQIMLCVWFTTVTDTAAIGCLFVPRLPLAPLPFVRADRRDGTTGQLPPRQQIATARCCPGHSTAPSIHVFTEPGAYRRPCEDHAHRPCESEQLSHAQRSVQLELNAVPGVP